MSLLFSISMTGSVSLSVSISELSEAYVVNTQHCHLKIYVRLRPKQECLCLIIWDLLSDHDLDVSFLFVYVNK